MDQLTVHLFQVPPHVKKRFLVVRWQVHDNVAQTPQRLPQGNLKLLESVWMLLRVRLFSFQSFLACLRFVAVLLKNRQRSPKIVRFGIF